MPEYSIVNISPLMTWKKSYWAMGQVAMEMAAFICSHVFENSRPILYVSRSHGDWQFLCGDEHPGEIPKVCGRNHLLQRDATLVELMDLPADWEAERVKPDDPWIKKRI